MDLIDIRILDALQNDASLTNSQLADQVGSTPSTCLRRIASLKRSGVLEKSVFLVKPQKLERRLKAIISIVTTNHGAKKMGHMIERIKAEPSINAVYGTTGDVDVIVIGNFVDMENFHNVCETLFDDDLHIERYTTYFVSKEYKETTHIPTDELERTIKG